MKTTKNYSLTAPQTVTTATVEDPYMEFNISDDIRIGVVKIPDELKFASEIEIADTQEMHDYLEKLLALENQAVEAKTCKRNSNKSLLQKIKKLIEK